MYVKDKNVNAKITAYVEGFATKQFDYLLEQYERVTYRTEFLSDEKERVNNILYNEDYIIPENITDFETTPFFVRNSIPILDRANFIEDKGYKRVKINAIEKQPDKNKVAVYHRRLYRKVEPLEIHLHLKQYEEKDYKGVIIELMPAVFLRYLDLLEKLIWAEQHEGYTTALEVAKEIVERQPKCKKNADRKSFELVHFPKAAKIYQSWKDRKETAPTTEIWLKEILSYLGNLAKEVHPLYVDIPTNNDKETTTPEQDHYYLNFFQNYLIYHLLSRLFNLKKHAAKNLVLKALEIDKKRFLELWSKSREQEKLLSIELERIESALTDRNLHILERPEMGKRYYRILGATHSEFSDQGFQNTVAYYHHFAHIEPQVNYWDDLVLSDAKSDFIGNAYGCKAEMFVRYRDWLRNLKGKPTKQEIMDKNVQEEIIAEQEKKLHLPTFEKLTPIIEKALISLNMYDGKRYTGKAGTVKVIFCALMNRRKYYVDSGNRFQKAFADYFFKTFGGKISDRTLRTTLTDKQKDLLRKVLKDIPPPKKTS